MTTLANLNLLLNIITLLLGGGALGLVLRHRREMPKAAADAALTQAQTDERDWGRFQKEIGRLEERISRLERDNTTLREDALKSSQREANLEQRVRSQKAHIERLERRLIGMERIFNLNGIPPEVRAELEKLERVSILSDLSQSEALTNAEHAVSDAKQTVRSATATYQEVKASEAGDPPKE